MKPPYRVGILGATGAVGQKFVELLDGHPWFTVTDLVASERSAGKSYAAASSWKGSSFIPDKVASLPIKRASDELTCDFVFSGLDSAVAFDIESKMAASGYPVISNARNFRMDRTVPLLIPEVNPTHLALVESQEWGSGGFIVTNPNCSTVGVVSAIKPLHDLFGLKAVHVTTMQALSGAGFPGVASMDIQGNVLPNIEGEEEKVESEPLKILGSLRGSEITDVEIQISAQCNRVPVVDGHLISIAVQLDRVPELDVFTRAFSDFTIPEEIAVLPSAPDQFLHVFDDQNYPQPARHASLGRGMTVSIGRIRMCPVLDFRFVALVHNTVRGAAGGAILNAELLASKGLLDS